MTPEKVKEVIENLISGKSKKKTTLQELEETLGHQDIQILPDGSVVCIKLTPTEIQALQFVLGVMEGAEQEKLEQSIKTDKFWDDLQRIRNGELDEHLFVERISQAITDYLWGEKK